MKAQFPRPLAALAVVTTLVAMAGCPSPNSQNPPATGGSATPKPSGTAKPTDAPGATPTPAATGTPKPTTTGTPAPTGTTTPAPTGTATPAATASPTASPTSTASPTASPTATPAATPAPASLKYFIADLPIAANVGAGGTAIAKMNDAGTSLGIKLLVVGATGDLTGAHLHEGAEGVTGGVVKELTLGSDKRSATGDWATGAAAPALTEPLLTALRSRGLYAAIHTAANAGGEARGQLKAYSWAFYADMAQVNGANGATNAKGAGWMWVDEAAGTTKIKLYTAGLTGDITGAHIHKGAAGVTGPVVKELTVSADKKTASGDWATGAADPALTPALLADLKAGNLYLAVHTAMNPNGEIRGQLMLP